MFYEDLVAPLRYYIKKNFYKTAVMNPFQQIFPLQKKSIFLRLQETYAVFAGINKYQHSFWETPQKSKHGLISFSIGMSSQFISNIIPAIGILILNLGRYCNFFINHICYVVLERQQDPLLKGLLKIGLLMLWVGMTMLIGAPLILLGTFAYTLTKAILHPLNWTIQTFMVPFGSFVALLTVSPIVGFVHLVVTLFGTKSNHHNEDWLDSRNSGKSFFDNYSDPPSPDLQRHFSYENVTDEITAYSEEKNVSQHLLPLEPTAIKGINSNGQESDNGGGVGFNVYGRRSSTFFHEIDDAIDRAVVSQERILSMPQESVATLQLGRSR